MRSAWCAILGVVLAATSGAPPALSTPSSGDVRAALEDWRLDEAERLLKSVSEPDKTLFSARLDLMRSRFGAVDKRLAGREASLGYEARVLRGLALQALGRHDEAFRVLDAMADDYNDDRVATASDLAWLGIGLVLTDYPKNALRVFKEALKADPKLLEAQLAWAELYRSKYNYQDADPLFGKALATAPGNIRALVGRARIAIESDRAFAEATALLTPVLEKSPDCVPCHNVLALVDLHNERPAAARARLETQSLRVAPEDPEALALLGAATYLMEDARALAALEKKALAQNPRNAAFFTTIAEHAEREHRYPEAVAFLERALTLAPEHADALSMLGTGYSRMGDDDRAREFLTRAFDADAYNVRTYNLLTHFYDKVDKDFEWVEAAPMRLRVDRDERPILADVVPPLVKEAHTALSKKWGFQPKLPLHIEIFSDTQTFAVRSTGLPGLAAHGICFGHVITARSPSAGNFNWAEVLWHELAHVFHLQLSKGRIPRWFTEGLALFESTEGRPAWEREQDRELLRALKAKKLRGIEDFNLSFTQAKSLQDIVLAYYHAYYVTRFIHDAWGFGKAREMVALWGDRKSTPEVFKLALGISLSDFDTRFFRWLTERFAYLERAYPFDTDAILGRADEALLKASSEDPEAQAEAALVLLTRREVAKALALSDKALAKKDIPLARFVRAMARIDDEGKFAEVKADLEALKASGQAGVDGHVALAKLLGRKKDTGAIAFWREAVALDPKREDLREGLIAALTEGSPEERSKGVFEARVALLALDQMNAKLALETLAMVPAVGADKARVTAIAEQAVHIAPFSVELHLAAMRALSASGASDLARAAATRALLLDPGQAEARAFLGL